jgi:hypothetical protein
MDRQDLAAVEAVDSADQEEVMEAAQEAMVKERTALAVLVGQVVMDRQIEQVQLLEAVVQGGGLTEEEALFE